MRQQAWLATPERENGKSRWHEMRAGGSDLEMPPLDEWNGSQKLIELLNSLGMAEFTGMGEVPLSWQTMRAWAELTETELPPGEWETLRNLSIEYVAACQEYRGKNLPPPYGRSPEAARKAQDQLKSALDSLVAGNGKRSGARTKPTGPAP